MSHTGPLGSSQRRKLLPKQLLQWVLEDLDNENPQNYKASERSGGADHLLSATFRSLYSPPLCPASKCDWVNFIGEHLQEFIGGGNQGEVAGIRDQDQFLLGRMDALEIFNGGLR